MLCRRVYEGILLGGSEKCAVKQIEIPIVYNKYGDYDPNGLLYVLKKDAARIRKEAFSHSLNRALSIHVQGLRYEVQTSDGASVGYNRDSTTKNQILYTWYADKEGVYSFQDIILIINRSTFAYEQSVGDRRQCNPAVHTFLHLVPYT